MNLFYSFYILKNNFFWNVISTSENKKTLPTAFVCVECSKSSFYVFRLNLVDKTVSS